MDLAVHNAWHDFRLAQFLLAGRGLSIRWDEEPFALRCNALGDAAATTLFHTLIDLLDAAIGRKLPAAELARRPGVRDRLEWAVGSGEAAFGAAVEKLLELYDRVHYREPPPPPHLEGLPEEEKPRLLAAYATGSMRPRIWMAHQRTLAQAVPAIEQQLVAWELIERPPEPALSFRRARHYGHEQRITPLGPEHIGVELVLTENGEEIGTTFTAVPIPAETTPADWPQVIGRFERVAALRKGFGAGAAQRVEEVLAGDARSAWIGGEIEKARQSSGEEIAAVEGLVELVEGEDRERMLAVADGLRETAAGLEGLAERLAGRG
jgi:hypothetical protein